MGADIQPHKRWDNVISSLDVTIEALNLAKEILSITPAKAVVGSVSALLVMIRDSMANEGDYVALGLTCADICTAIKEGMDGKKESDLNEPIRKAIERLERAVMEIKLEIESKTEGRNKLKGLLLSVPRAKNEKEVIARWRTELSIILEIFNTQLSINTHVIVSDIRDRVSGVNHNVCNISHDVSELRRDVSDIRRDVSQIRGRTEDQILSTHVSPGELPPPPPRALFGRDELIEEIIGLVDGLTPIALLGVGGIGKTSIALTILHHDRIKERFGDDRRFIRCDQLQATRIDFLRRLSKVIGAHVDNPEDLTPLRPFLSAKEMFIVLDNAESILDPQGMDAQRIYNVVEELSQLGNICLCITSRISIIPPDCKALDIPTLSMDAARNTFYRIYEHNERSDLVNDILKRLDFHPLSVTLLATVAHHNKWGTDRLIKEWERRHTDVLHTRHNKSLAATIELSLASPMFQDLGPDARDLLGVIAFFPQGVDENNLNWLFPTISNHADIFDKFCILSLTYRSDERTTMLAPLRDYLRPRDPKSSPLLCATKDRYFSRLSADIDPGEPGFEETRWVTSEDVNVEHLLDVFTSIDPNSTSVWDACADFTRHLRQHKQQLVMLEPKIGRLLDGHPSKPRCLFELSRLLYSVENFGESKWHIIHALELWRELKDDRQVARTLKHLAHTNRQFGLNTEGISQAKEALEICERLNYTVGQADSLECLALLLTNDHKLDAAEEAASRAINLYSDKPSQPRLYRYHHILGHIYKSRGETEAAVRHHETALGIASSLDSGEQIAVLRCLVHLLLGVERFDDVQVHLERFKSHSFKNPYDLGWTMALQAISWSKQGRFEEAKSEILRAITVFEKTGGGSLTKCIGILGEIEGKMRTVTPDESDGDEPE